MKTLETPTDEVRLTNTEVRVLSLIARGASSHDVAEHMFVSKRTIDFHLANIYEKLHVHNRISAIRRARSFGLLPGDPYARDHYVT